MRIFFYFLFFNNILHSQWNVEQITYETFYKSSLDKIIQIKKINNSKFNIQNYWHIAELYEKINIEDSAYANYYKIFEYQRTNIISKELYLETLLKLHLTESS